MRAPLPCEWRQSSFRPRPCSRLAVCRVRDALRPSQPSSVCQEWRLIVGADERTTTAERWTATKMWKAEQFAPRGFGSALPESQTKRAPVAAADKDRRGCVLHQHEIAAAHVTPVGLKQERLGVGRDSLHGAVVEEAAVAAIRIIPDRIFALWQTI